MIVNESNTMVYVADPETYELIYVNQVTRDNFDIGPEVLGKKCYEVLQGLDAPCSFCTNDKLSTDQYYVWRHYNPVLKADYELSDKLLCLDDGKCVRMEICRDVTEFGHLERKLSIEETLVDCIHTLSENKDMDTAIKKLLKIIGEFFRADRAYIFEIDYDNQTFTNTYEWCKEGVTPQIQGLKALPLSLLERWFEIFYKKEEFYISSLDESVEPDSSEYQILAEQGIESLMAEPFWNGEQIRGFIGVDNPSCGIEQIKLLRSVAYFIVNDIDKRHMMSRLEYLSYRDILTGLGNRNLYTEVLEKFQKEKLKSLGIVFIDINGMKEANEKYGHEYGDKLIQNVADGLKKIFPENAYRIGGDEFVALFINGEREEFERRLVKLRKFEKEDSRCDFSMGINYSEGDVNLTEQLGYSGSMMYLEKQSYYGMALNGGRTYHELLAREVAEQIQKGAFEVYLQPKIDLETGGVSGAEALVRRHGEQGELIPPDHFIPLYEAEGVIPFVDTYVFEQVCRLLSEWREKNYRLIPVSVNISRVSLMGMDIVSRMARIRDRYQIPPDFLMLEVTESISKIGSELSNLMQKFKEYNFRVSLDDYGSRYSNLEILTKVRFQELKIDKSLLDDIVGNERARLILKSSIQMCRELGQLKTVAEGIETEAQMQILKELNCDMGQGYYFSRPLPADAFAGKYLREHEADI